MRRIVVVGNSGSGKTTLAAELSDRLAVPHIELDSLYHQRGWVPATREQFLGALCDRLDAADDSADGWVTCGNYAQVRTVLWCRADTLVWLDLPRRVVMSRVIRRSVVRAIQGRELWNGNRESWANLLALHDPQRSIIRWTWDGVTGYRARLGPLLDRPTWADLRRHHLTSTRQVATWLAAVPGQSPRG